MSKYLITFPNKNIFFYKRMVISLKGLYSNDSSEYKKRGNKTLPETHSAN